MLVFRSDKNRVAQWLRVGKAESDPDSVQDSAY